MPLHHTRFLAICAFAAAAHAQVIASIGGQVYNSATDEPVNGATIILSQTNGDGKPQEFVTEKRGLFLFENLPPGRYLLFAECPGFARTAFGARGNSLSGVTLSLVEAQQMNNLAFALTPAATIAGTITDDSGAAVQGARVLALQPVYQRAKREYLPVASALSDASGDYKIESLNAGEYLLAVSVNTGTTFFPSAAAISGAQRVVIAATATETGKDIRMIKPSGRRVAGTLTGGKAAIAWLTPKGGATSLVQRIPAKIQPDGTFSFSDVTPGSYLLNATESDGVTNAGVPISVAVAQKDIDEITLHAQAGSDLEGDVALGTNEIALPPGIQIILETADAPLPRPVRATVDAKGKFRIPMLAPGRYLLHVLAPEGLYVRTARYRGADILEEPFDFGGAPAPMLIQLSASGASAGGSVHGSDGSSMPGATVALVPTLHRLSRFKEVTTDQFGEYHFDGIAPGDYRIYAFDHITPGQYEDSQWMKKYEFKGQSFTAKSGGKETIPLKAIE